MAVTYALSRGYDDPVLPLVAKKLRPDVGVQMRVLFVASSALDQHGGIQRLSSEVVQALTETGPYHVEVISRSSQGRLLSYADLLVRVGRAAKQGPPAVMFINHVHLTPVAYLAKRLWGTSTCGIVYGEEVWSPGRAIQRWGVGCLDRVASISIFTANRFRNTWGYKGPIDVIPPPTTPVAIPSRILRQETDRNRSSLRALTVSRLVRGKGLPIALRAHSSLIQGGIALQLDIIGQGPLRDELEALVRQLGTEDYVAFHGSVSDDELRGAYANADFFVLPSRKEGFGLVFLEAMAHGLPVIGVDATAVPEVVTHGETGFLVGPDDSVGLAECMQKLCRNANLRRSMGDAARRRSGEFDWESFKLAIDEFVRLVVSRRG